MGGNVGRRGKETRPSGMSEHLVARDTSRVRIRANGSGDSPRGFLNKDTIRQGSREKREESSVSFTQINRHDEKRKRVV